MNLQEHRKTQKWRLQRVQALAANQGEAGRSDLKTKRFDSILFIGLWCTRRCRYYFSASALLHVRPRLQAGALTHSLSLVLSILFQAELCISVLICSQTLEILKLTEATATNVYLLRSSAVIHIIASLCNSTIVHHYYLIFFLLLLFCLLWFVRFS